MSDREPETLGRLMRHQNDWALSMTGITARDKVVLLGLIKRINRVERYCYPSLDVLGKDTGLPVKSVSKAIQALSKCGLVEVERRGKKQTNFYVVKCPGMDDLGWLP